MRRLSSIVVNESLRPCEDHLGGRRGIDDLCCCNVSTVGKEQCRILSSEEGSHWGFGRWDERRKVGRAVETGWNGS